MAPLQLVNGSKTVVVFDTSEGERLSNLAGLSAAAKLLDWLQANAMAPTRKMLLDAYEDRFFACGMLGGELNARTTVRMSEFLDQMIGQHFGTGAPLAEFEGEEFRMQSAFLEGAAKYRGWESKQAALDWHSPLMAFVLIRVHLASGRPANPHLRYLRKPTAPRVLLNALGVEQK